MDELKGRKQEAATLLKDAANLIKKTVDIFDENFDIKVEFYAHLLDASHDLLKAMRVLENG